MNAEVATALWHSIECRLHTADPGWRDKIIHFGQVAAVEARGKGRRWTDAEVFEGLVRSVLSNSVDWEKVERVLPQLVERLHGFDPRWYASLSPAYVLEDLEPWFKGQKAGSTVLRRGLERMIQAARRLLAESERHGSMHDYFNSLFEQEGHDPKRMVIALGSGSYTRPHRLPGLGIPLAAEFLRNIGFDISKPDRHINRACGCFGLVQFSRWPDCAGTTPPMATEAELRAVMQAMEDGAQLVEGSGLPVAFLDNAVWLLCAKSGAKKGLYLSNQQLEDMRCKIDEKRVSS